MIRLAGEDDCPRLAEIHVLGWRTAYRGFIDDVFLFGQFLVKMREEKFREACLNKTEETYVYQEDKIVKAFLTIGNCRDEDKSERCFELWGVYVDPFFFREGIGTKLVTYCIGEAKNRKRDEVILWVFEKNYESRAFYEKQGFVFDGKKKYLDFFHENAIRYCKKILSYSF